MPKNSTQINSEPHRPDGLIGQIWRYILYGAFATAVDFAVMNLCLYVFHMPTIIANTISLSISLLVSFSLSEKLIFRGEHKHSRRRQVIYFVIMTLIGQYGLQSGMFAVLSDYPLAQNAIASFLAPLLGHIPYAVVAANAMKLLATIATGIWGFVLSRHLVFAHNQTTAPASN